MVHRVLKLHVFSVGVFLDETNVESVDSVKQTALPNVGGHHPVH